MFTSWTSADVHIMLLGLTWLKPCKTQGNHFCSVCTAQLRVQLGREDMAQLEGSLGMPRDLENLTKKAHVPKENAKGETWRVFKHVRGHCTGKWRKLVSLPSGGMYDINFYL